MAILGTASQKSFTHVLAAASVALLGLSFSACSAQTSDVPDSPAAAPTATTASAAPTTTTAPAATAAPAAGRLVTLSVQGTRSDALIETVIVTSEGKESGSSMSTKTLPFNEELTLPADSTFNKILVLGKYPDGGTEDISCSITVDGKQVASQSSSNHKPAKCLFLEGNNQ